MLYHLSHQGSSQLSGGVNNNLLQEGLYHTQVYCIQSPCPCSSPLLTIPPQETLKHCSVSVSVGSRVLVHTRYVWALWASLVGMGFDSKCHFTSPTILLGLKRLEISSEKIRDSKGIFNAKMGSIDKNGMHLTEAKNIKKRWQEYTEELYKKDLHYPDNDGVITHLQPYILECEVKWALGSITTSKASGSDGIPVELFQILKDDAGKVLHSICQQIWKTQQWPQDWKRSVFIPIPKKGNAKECSDYHTDVLISHASKGILKILQARLQQYVNHELPDVQAGFRNGRGTRDQIANIRWIIKRAREFQKNIYFCFIDYAKAFDCVDHNKPENSSRGGNTRPPDLHPVKSVCRSRSNS